VPVPRVRGRVAVVVIVPVSDALLEQERPLVLRVARGGGVPGMDVPGRIRRMVVRVPRAPRHGRRRKEGEQRQGGDTATGAQRVQVDAQAAAHITSFADMIRAACRGWILARESGLPVPVWGC
jgi:hypothetical protein